MTNRIRKTDAFKSAARSKWYFADVDAAAATKQTHLRDRLAAEIKAKIAARKAQVEEDAE